MSGYTGINNKTTPADVDVTIPEIWALESLRKVKVDGFWGKFVGGEHSGAPLIQKTELLNKPGDLIHIAITDVLVGAGVTGDTALLVDQEEGLTATEMKMATQLYRHAVRINARAEKKSILDLKNEGRFRLEEWHKTKIDTIRFTTILGVDTSVLPAALVGETYVPNAVSFDAAAGSGLDSTTVVPDDVAAADFVSVKGLQALRVKLEGQQANYISSEGEGYYAYVNHPNAFFWLKQDTRYEAWVREARERGKENPLFTGALAVIDGMILYSHLSVPTVVNASSVKVGKGIAFGGEAFGEALDENIRFDADTFDYGNQFGMAVRVAFSSRRMLEKNSCIAYAAATNV